jgi:hypothetical protein
MFTRLQLKQLLREADKSPQLIAGLISFYIQKIVKLDNPEKVRLIHLISTHVLRKISNLSEVALILFFNEDYVSLRISRILTALKKNFCDSIPSHLFEQPITKNQINFLAENSINIFGIMSGKEFIHPSNIQIIIKLLSEEKISDLECKRKMNDVQIKVWHILSMIYASNPKIVEDFVKERINPIWSDTLLLLITSQFRDLGITIYPLNMDSYTSCVAYSIPWHVCHITLSKYSTWEEFYVIQNHLQGLSPKLDFELVMINLSYLGREFRFNELVMSSLQNFRIGLVNSGRLTLQSFSEFTTQVVNTTKSNSTLVNFLLRFGLDIQRVIHCIPMHLRENFIIIS